MAQAALTLCLVLVALLHECQGQVTCLSCSYNNAGDGTTNYGCVSLQYNYKLMSTVDCAIGRCYSRAVYSQGYAQLNSFVRKCSLTTEEKFHCESPDRLVPQCEFVCSGDRCNNITGDLWSLFQATGTGSRSCLSLTLTAMLGVVGMVVGVMRGAV